MTKEKRALKRKFHKFLGQLGIYEEYQRLHDWRDFTGSLAGYYSRNSPEDWLLRAFIWPTNTERWINAHSEWERTVSQ